MYFWLTNIEAADLYVTVLSFSQNTNVWVCLIVYLHQEVIVQWQLKGCFSILFCFCTVGFCVPVLYITAWKNNSLYKVNFLFEIIIIVILAYDLSDLKNRRSNTTFPIYNTERKAFRLQVAVTFDRG
jgi:hypothetical protein